MRRRTVLIAFAAVIFLLGAMWLWTVRRQPKEVTAAFDSLRKNRYDLVEKQKAAGSIIKAGDAAYPELARALQQKDTVIDQKYARWRRRLPDGIRERLPELQSKDELRGALANSLHTLGPVASRALVGAMEHAVDPAFGLGNMEALRALYWSIPESPKAVHFLSNWLAHPKPGLPLFGMRDAHEIWPSVGHLAPLLTNWLILADTTREAADALGLMGTNAVAFLPLLIEVAEQGFAGGPTNARLHMRYTQELAINVLHWNRASAIAALGKLGVPSKRVLDALKLAATHESPLLRAKAANALGDLGPGALPALPHLLSHLDESHEEVLRFQLEAIGRMGPAAREAIPALLRFSTAREAAKERSAAPLGQIVRWDFDPAPLPVAAAVSLCQIDPERAKERLDYAWHGLMIPIATNTIVQLRPMRGDLVALAEPSLGQGELWQRGLLAYNLLLLDPRHRGARQVLEQQMNPTNHFERRSAAAKWLFLATGEAARAVQVFSETLKQVADHESQLPISLVRELGPAARELAPQIRPLLEHEDGIIRMLAGKALRSVAPDKMPPIIEDADW